MHPLFPRNETSLTLPEPQNHVWGAFYTPQQLSRIIWGWNAGTWSSRRCKYANRLTDNRHGAVQTAHLHTPVCLLYFTKIHVISCHFSISGSSLTWAAGLFPFLAEGCGFQGPEARWILPLTWSIRARLLRQLLKAKLPLQRCITGCHSDRQWGVIFLDHEEVPMGKFRPHDDSDSDSKKPLVFHVYPFNPFQWKHKSMKVQWFKGQIQFSSQTEHQQIQSNNKPNINNYKEVIKGYSAKCSVFKMNSCPYTGIPTIR